MLNSTKISPREWIFLNVYQENIYIFINRNRNLQKCLKRDLGPQEYPLNFHNRTEQVLNSENVKTFKKLHEIKEFAESNQMVISSKKTKIMVFNKSLIYDFMPEINIFHGETLKVVEEFMLDISKSKL